MSRNIQYSSFLSQMNDAKNMSIEFLHNNNELCQILERIHCFREILIEIPNCESSLCIPNFSPLLQARISLNESIHLAILGNYKTAYGSLRCFIELSLLDIYYSTLLEQKNIVDDWINGKLKTPTFQIVKITLFKQRYFYEANKEFQFQNMIEREYKSLCNYVHTKGAKHSYMNLNYSNYPRFNKTSLALYITDCLRVCEIIAIALVLRYPIVLEPLPYMEKLGLRLPPIGCFEYFEVMNIENIINADYLTQIKNIIKNDEHVLSIKNWIMSLPDLTEEEWEVQLAEDMRTETLNNW